MLILFFSLLFSASASMGSKGLIIEGGKQQINLQKGEKEYLNIRDGLTNLPLLKGITFYSDNTMVATVGQHSGVLRANGYGKATIYAVSQSGDAGKITVCVVNKRKKKFQPIIFIISIIILPLFFIIKKNGIR